MIYSKKTILAIAAMVGLGLACTPSEPEVEETVSQKVTATLVGEAGAAWTSSDVLGVYTNASEKNVKYACTSASKGTFTASTEVSGTPQYAYYPYSTDNASRNATGLKGNVPQDQTAAKAGYLPYDYRYGVQTGTNSDGDVEYEMHSVLANVFFTVETAGSALEGQEIVSVTCKVTRDGAAVPVCGGFSFSAADGAYTYDGYTTYNEFTTAAYATIFPTVKSGDVLEITAKSADAEAVATMTVEGEVVAGGYYEVTVQLPEAEVVEPEGPETPETPEEPETPVEPETPAVTAGTFTVATYNVDGLPKKISFFTINGDGPGSDGTKTISSAIAAEGWDIVGFSEDFAYHSELTSALGAYTFGTHRGSVSSISSNNTDGLCFATLNSTCSFGSETIVEYTSDYGGITSGANTCIKKGFRYYPVTLADGVVIDVYITHMNTYSSSGTGHINAQHKQLAQLAAYVSEKAMANGRPAIIMGDTNCRYTRHDFQTYFWSKFDSSLTINDPWVDYMWDGVYPTYPSNSLVVEDATGTSSSDIICDSQKGEVVDKVIYINNPSSKVQISANGYLRDSAFQGLADHWPIVVEFTYTVAE